MSKRIRPRFAPTPRLMLVVAIGLLPPALAEIVAPVAAQILLVGAGLLVVVALLDAVQGVNTIGGVEASMRPLTRLVLDRDATLEVMLRSGAKSTPARRLGLGLVVPPALGVSVAEATVVVPEGGALVRTSWRAHPRRRGVHRIERVYFEGVSPLGLWAVRWSVAVAAEVRVYPNLMAEGRQLAAFLLRRQAAGWRSMRLVGRGRDFEKLREYVPGDGFDEVHWKATAKRGHPVTKVFQVERTQEVYAVVDASRMSGRAVQRRVAAGTTPADEMETDDTLLERQANAALALALAAERQSDLFGLATFTDRPRAFVRAKGGPAHFQACREALVGLQPAAASPDFREVCTFLRARLTKRALLVFLTSLDDPAMAESFVEAIALVARRHLVLVVATLPPDAEPLFHGAAPATLDAAYARLSGHVRWQSLQELEGLLHRHGVQLALLPRDELAAGAVSRYVAIKQRQQL